jgi:hypothetical protein
MAAAMSRPAPVTKATRPLSGRAASCSHEVIASLSASSRQFVPAMPALEKVASCSTQSDSRPDSAWPADYVVPGGAQCFGVLTSPVTARRGRYFEGVIVSANVKRIGRTFRRLRIAEISAENDNLVK